MILTSPSITPYKRRYRQDVRDLIYRSYRTHSHLDWQDSDQWLDSEESAIRLAWSGGRLVGFMAMSLPLSQTCWLRMAAIDDDAPPQAMLSALWDNIVPELREQGIHTVALLVLRDWVANYIQPLGFRYIEDIVTMRRGTEEYPIPPMNGVVIRPVLPADLPTIARVDQAAFTPPWQLTLSELRHAERASAYCTVALVENALVGYQLSTLYFDGAHLARLAVDPDAQGHGVGSVLLHDLLERFTRREVLSTTVNTQVTNVRSQRLYRRFGFQRNGYDLPVWMAEI